MGFLADSVTQATHHNGPNITSAQIRTPPATVSAIQTTALKQRVTIYQPIFLFGGCGTVS